MPCKTCKKSKKGEIRSKTLMISNQILPVSWKPVNSQDCVWKNLSELSWGPYRRKRGQFTTALQFGTQIFPMPQAMKIPAAKAAVEKKWEKLEKVPAWDLTKAEVNHRWSKKQGRGAPKVHFASLVDICHLENAELETTHQKYKGRVVLRGDIVKDDSGSYAVFTEQGSSASQMTAAKVMDMISRQPGCSGQAADAVSACTQVKMKDAPKLLKIFKSECPDMWIRLQWHKWPKSWSNMEDPVVLLERLMMYNHTSWLKTSHVSSVFMSASCHPHTIHGERLIVCCFSVPRFVLFLVSLLHLAFLFPLLPVFCPEPLLPCEQRRGKHTLRLRQTRSLALWQNSLFPQVISPSSMTISTTRRLLKWSSRRNPATKIRSPRTCVMRNSTMRPSAERSLHHCSFKREENQRTEDKLITLLKKVCCQLNHCSPTQERRDPCTNLVRPKFVQRKTKSRNGKRNHQDSPRKTKKSKFLLKSGLRSRSTSFKPILIGEVFRNWMELSSLSEEKLIMLLQEMNNFDEINYFMNNYPNKIGIVVKLIWKVLVRWKNWSDFKGQHSMNFREEDWSKIKTLSLKSRPEFRNYRMKLIVWMIREILKMLNQYAVDYPTLPVNQRYTHLFEILAEC